MAQVQTDVTSNADPDSDEASIYLSAAAPLAPPGFFIQDEKRQVESGCKSELPIDPGGVKLDP